MKIAFIVGSLESGRDGVGDYARALAQECVRKGHSCTLLSINDRWIEAPLNAMEKEDQSNLEAIPILRLPQSLPYQDRSALAQTFLDAFGPECVSLQFVPYAFQNKGVVTWLATFLFPLVRSTFFHIMFHELWIGSYTTAPLKERWMGKVQRHYILSLVRQLRPQLIHTSNRTYVSLLSRYKVEAGVLPLFGSIPLTFNLDDQWLYEACAKGGSSLTPANRKKWWIFGFFGTLSSVWPSEPLFSHIRRAAQESSHRIIVASAGRLGDEEYWQELASEYSSDFVFLHLGELETERVSQYLKFIDFGLATAPYNLIGKSSVVAAMREHGLPIIVNRDDWHLPGENNPALPPDPLVYVLDGTLPDKLKSGWPKGQPRAALPRVALLFLTSLHEGSQSVPSLSTL